MKMRMRMVFLVLVGILGVFLLGGCGMNEDVEVATGTQVVVSSKTATEGVTDTPVPTRSPTQVVTNTPSLTNTPIPSSTPKPTWWFDVECSSFTPIGLAELTPLSGSIVFQNGWRYCDNEVCILNMETGDTLLLPDVGYRIATHRQSPDHKWVAFEDYESSELKLLNAKGETFTLSDWDDESWASIIGWLGPDQILIRLWDKENRFKLLPHGLFNIQTKTFSKIERNFPDHNNMFEHDGPIYWYTSTFFDHNLTRVGYTTQPGGFALYDLQTEQVISRLENYGRPSSKPKWSPDGNYLLVSATFGKPIWEWHDDFFLLHKNGEIEQLTHFNETYEESRIGSFSWSPDNRFVAFWYYNNTYDFDYEYISILELDTRSVTTYCIANEVAMGPAALPIWSPDSKAFVIRRGIYIRDVLNSQVDDLILVNIHDNYARWLGRDLHPLGWLINDSTE